MVGMLTNTTYQFFLNGINMGWACKPFGGILGGPLTSDNFGKLSFILLHDQRHSTGYITTNMNVVQSYLKCELRPPSGPSGFFYMPLYLKPTQ